MSSRVLWYALTPTEVDKNKHCLFCVNMSEILISMKYFLRQTLRLVFRFLMMFVFVPSIVSAESVTATQRNNADRGKQFSQTWMPWAVRQSSAPSTLTSSAPLSATNADFAPMEISRESRRILESVEMMEKRSFKNTSPRDAALTWLRQRERRQMEMKKRMKVEKSKMSLRRTGSIIALWGVYSIFRGMLNGSFFSMSVVGGFLKVAGGFCMYGVGLAFDAIPWEAAKPLIVVSIVVVCATYAIMVLFVVLKNFYKIKKKNSGEGYTIDNLLPEWKVALVWWLIMGTLIVLLYQWSVE